MARSPLLPSALLGRFDGFRAAERLMGMDEASWRRHASPWSVWTRVPVLPLLALTAWSRVWIGWWALLPASLLILWLFANPRAFRAPGDLTSWASRGVMGERLFLDRHGRARRGHSLPRHPLAPMKFLTILARLGLFPLAYGLVVLDSWAVLCGLAVSVGAKMWFVDRCAWLYDEASGQAPSTPIAPPTPFAPR